MRITINGISRSAHILRRASPFPAFPAAKPGTQDSFIAPVNFGH
jgi:hypothetical protein